MKTPRSAHTITLFLTLLYRAVEGFVPTSVPLRMPWGLSSTLASTNEPDVCSNIHASSSSISRPSVRAPLKWIGPYPCLALTFPNLATSSQRQNNVSGISLDFVLDTAANVNTINGQVAQVLQLNQTGQALPGVGSSGPITGDLPTFMLGDSQLEGQRKEDSLFMTELTASVLPVASPGTAGLLSLAFLQTFPGGVDFCWGTKMNNGDIPSPSITFYDSTSDADIKGRERVVLERIPVTQLPVVTVRINGVEMPALLDTGSPITVLNAQAAEVAGIDTIDIAGGNKKKGMNPFSEFTERFQKAKAASEGKVLTIMGPAGKSIDLIKSREKVDLTVKGDDGRDVSFGSGYTFVGDIPGLAALQGLGVDAPPAVVLGMDFLRARPKMLVRAQQNEVWF